MHCLGKIYYLTTKRTICNHILLAKHFVTWKIAFCFKLIFFKKSKFDFTFMHFKVQSLYFLFKILSIKFYLCNLQNPRDKDQIYMDRVRIYFIPLSYSNIVENSRKRSIFNLFQFLVLNLRGEGGRESLNQNFIK